MSENSDQMGMIDRSAADIPTTSEEELNAPSEWRGLPRFEAAPERISLVLAFESEADREKVIEKLGLVIAKKTKGSWSAWWPPREREDLAALRFDFGEEA